MGRPIHPMRLTRRCQFRSKFVGLALLVRGLFGETSKRPSPWNPPRSSEKPSSNPQPNSCPPFDRPETRGLSSGRVGLI